MSPPHAPLSQNRHALALAALSVCSCGWGYGEPLPAQVRLLALLGGLAAFWATYRFNDWVDDRIAHVAAGNESRLLRQCFGATASTLALAAALPFASRCVLFALLIIGVSYSGFQKNRGLKRFVHLKNLVTGLGWGLLVLLPNGAAPDALCMVLWVTLQVWIGSVVRDIDDATQDSAEGLCTLANTWTQSRRDRALMIANLLAALVVLVGHQAQTLPAALALVVFWRFFQLWMHRNRNLAPWLKTQLNLGTCHLTAVITWLC